MFRNNFLAFLIHIIVGLITFRLFTFVDSFAIDNKIRFGDFFYNTGTISIFLFALLLYLLSGMLLYRQEKRIKSFLSVSGVSIIGLCLWLVCFIITGGIRVGGSLNWIPFVFYTAYSLPLLMTFSIESPYVALLFALMPSVLMWAGIQMWSKRKTVI